MRLLVSPAVRQQPALQRLVNEAMELADKFERQGDYFGPEVVQQQMEMYRQGGAVFLRDLRRDWALLCQLWWLRLLAADSSAGSNMPAAQRKRAARLQADLLSAIPFAFIILNTVPLTPLVMPLLARHVPRRFLMPSQFEEDRLASMQRLARAQQRQPTTSLPVGRINKAGD